MNARGPFSGTTGPMRPFAGGVIPLQRVPMSSREDGRISRPHAKHNAKTPEMKDRASCDAGSVEPIYLSDMISFESDTHPDGPAPVGNHLSSEELVEHASKALIAADNFVQQRGPKREPEVVPEGAPSATHPPSVSQQSDLISHVSPLDNNPSSIAAAGTASGTAVCANDATRRDLRSAFEKKAQELLKEGSFRKVPKGRVVEPAWPDELSSGGPSTLGTPAPPILLPSAQVEQTTEVLVKELERPDFLDFQSQGSGNISAASATEVPPLQSVMELTTAVEPPCRGGDSTLETSTAAAARALEDGSGVLPDGTKWERKSGEEKGKNGYWRRWTKLSGSTTGEVRWEEHWWEVSDWSGAKELGAIKTGSSPEKGAWRETWTEKLNYHRQNLRPVIERTANKWARAADGKEWEEKWGEHYESGSKTSKWADKWANGEAQVWHERWGEEYDGCGGCVKWTDKWAEAVVEGCKVEWGDKWEERFADGKGTKQGETWNIAQDGNRYQKWWGETHHGNGWVQKYGNSTTGESWDVSEEMDTYYNPVPHFGFGHAIIHSPQLLAVPELPRDDSAGELGSGLIAL